MRVDPDDAAWTAHLRHPDERAERDGVVAAEHERQGTAPGGSRDKRRQAVAEIEDLAEVAGVLVAHVRGLDDRRDDVAGVGDVERRACP